MDRIFNKIKLQSYKSFKEFMDEMVDMFSRFRDYYHDAQIHSREVGLQLCFFTQPQNNNFSQNVAKLLNTTFPMPFAILLKRGRNNKDIERQ